MDLSALNPEQRRAAETLEGPVLILAGAGSGKTRALTYRVANLIDHGIPAWSVLALTFTNKAAKEIKERLQAALDDEEASKSVWTGTFHSVCVRILRQHCDKCGYRPGFTIYDTDDSKKTILGAMERCGIDEKLLPVKGVMNAISRAKDKLLTPDDVAMEAGQDFRAKQIARVYETYHRLR